VQVLPRCTQLIADRFVPAITVENPGYVYITVRINKSFGERHVYWHLTDPAFSLLELGFEWPAGRLTAISVPLFKGAIGEALTVPGAVRGEPLFDLHELGFDSAGQDLAPPVIKNKGRISLHQSGEDLDIVLDESPLVRSFSCYDKVIYGLNAEDRLSFIRLRRQSLPLLSGNH
jgi:hypothetical protein